jgi:intergrase/recombinase
MGVRLGFNELIEVFEATAEFYRGMFSKIVEKGVTLRLPVDVISATHTDIELAKQEQVEYETHLASMIQQQSKSHSKAMKNSGLHNSSVGMESMHSQSLQGHMPAKHWIDRLVYQGKVKEVRFEVAKLWNEQIKHIYQNLAERGIIDHSQGDYKEHPLTKG